MMPMSQVVSLLNFGTARPHPVKGIIPNTVDQGFYDGIRGGQFPSGPGDEVVAGHRDDDVPYGVYDGTTK